MRSQAIVNITSRPQNFTASHVYLTTLVIENVTEEAIVNQEVCYNIPNIKLGNIYNISSHLLLLAVG